MKTLKVFFLVIMSFLYLTICTICRFLVPTAAGCWLLSSFIMFIIIMRKANKWMKISAIPIAFLCCIIAYYHGSVLGPTDWWTSDGLFHASLQNYTLYRWSTFCIDCAELTLFAWGISFLVLILITKLKR